MTPHERRGYAAAPHQRRNVPWLLSTLFPALPRHSERHFRLGLMAGLGVVIALGALRLFPVALIVAALLMPLLVALYFYDVDIYQGEPLWAWLASSGWGAAAGVGAGLASRALAPGAVAVMDRGSTYHLITGGVILPALGMLLLLAGPVLLLRHPRFHETLDGAAFAAASAAAFAAGQAVVVGLDVLAGGLRPQGAAVAWVIRLVAVGLATPVLTMSAAGGAGAAIWLRFRAPARDRHALGATGGPGVAVVLAAVLVAAGAVGEPLVAGGVWLAWLAALDAVGLILLRRALHVGLLEEQSERPIGAPVRCANCGASTPSHSFCANCGIALRALPRDRRVEAADGRGGFAGRLAGRAHRRLAVLLGASLALGGLGAAVAVAAAREARRARCAGQRQCGRPPIVPAPTGGYAHWRSPALGYSLRYLPSQWRPAARNPQGITLQSSDGASQLSVSGSSTAAPRRLISQRAAALGDQLLGLAADPDPREGILGPEIGLIPGIAAMYVATATTPQGPQRPVLVAVLAARRHRLAVVVTMITSADNQDQRQAADQQADDIINSLAWPSR